LKLVEKLVERLARFQVILEVLLPLLHGLLLVLETSANIAAPTWKGD
jgi:hypothetical protein